MFIAAESIPEKEAKYKLMKNILNFLPEKNKKFLSYICIFLHELALHEEGKIHNKIDNKMNPSNLSVVFAPNLLKSKEEYSSTSEMMKDQTLSISSLTTLIVECDYFFLDGEIKKDKEEKEEKNDEKENENEEEEIDEVIEEKIDDNAYEELLKQFNISDLNDVYKKINEETWDILESVDISEDGETLPSFETYYINSVNYEGETIN
jgi:hypothetical protein